ncbi:hypothetical protein D1007_29677 [Hordeum vulgare]|nr:hypothetical protein D1007_29677 [Hordeum vulgare]
MTAAPSSTKVYNHAEPSNGGSASPRPLHRCVLRRISWRPATPSDAWGTSPPPRTTATHGATDGTRRRKARRPQEHGPTTPASDVDRQRPTHGDWFIGHDGVRPISTLDHPRRGGRRRRRQPAPPILARLLAGRCAVHSLWLPSPRNCSARRHRMAIRIG